MNIKGNFKSNKNNYVKLNGNIYNVNELINKNTNKKFTNIEDKILFLFDIYNEKLFDVLDGEFIILINYNNCMYIARDKIGTKHLYYYIKGKTLYFSEELKDIIKLDNFKNKIDKNQLGYYLCRGFINEPNTIFKNVYKLESGEFIKFDGSRLYKEKYYDIVKNYKIKQKKQEKNFMNAKENLKQILESSIKKRTKDNQIGVFLSGGVDSTLVCELANKMTDYKINTYTIGFYDEVRNEANESKKIAEFIGTNHHEKYITKDEVKKIIKESSKIYSEPFSDPSLIPIILLNQIVEDKNQLILTGDGADQLFCGSTIYDKLSFRYTFERIASKYSHGFVSLYKTFDFIGNIFARKQIFIRKILYYDNKPITFNHLIFKKRVKYMLFDLTTFLPNRLFYKTNYPSKFYNNNISAPISDIDVVNYSLSLKEKFRYYKGAKKYILKNILYDYVPKELINSKKKGFGIPLIKWIREIFIDDILKYSDKDILRKQNIFNYNNVYDLIDQIKKVDDYSIAFVLWSYYIFQLWYQEYIEDLWN